MSTAFVRRGANLLVTGGLAGVVAWIGARYSLLSWVTFIAWVACVFSGASSSAAAMALFAMLAGGLFGCVAGWLAQPFMHILGQFSLPFVLCVAVGLIALLEELPSMGNVPIYFLGMIAYFASGMPPSAAAMVSIAIPAVLGIACGLLCPVARNWLEKRADLLLR
ncbi:DUF1097 domain-containing protein [Bradyrhizobium sp. URHC0002]